MTLRVGGVRSPVVIFLATPERARCGRADGVRGCWTGACGSRGRARQRGAAGDTRRASPFTARAPRHSSGTPPLRVSEPGGAAPLGGSARRRRPRALTRSGGRIFCLGCTRSVWYTVSQFARDRTRERGSRAFFIAALFVFRSGVTGVEQARSHTPVFWRFRRVRVIGAGFWGNADCMCFWLEVSKICRFRLECCVLLRACAAQRDARRGDYGDDDGARRCGDVRRARRSVRAPFPRSTV